MIGNRVVRGPDWSREKDEDGGEGGVGTIVRSEESLDEVDQTVVVCWDTGHVDLYRTGPDGFCDLRVLDSAPTGVTSNNFWCDGCGNQTDIAGMRWHCVECAELSYDLCSLCYHGDKHDTSHNFIRFDSPSHPGTSVGMRSAVARVQARGIYPGALVQRGRDWDLGPNCDDLDGIVCKLATWEETARSSALVQWGDIEEYHRIGYDGKVDLKLQDCDSAQGPLYYREHLPTAMSPSRAGVAVQTDATIEASAAEQPTQKITKDNFFANLFDRGVDKAVEITDTIASNVESKMLTIAVKFHNVVGNLIGKENRMIKERRDFPPELEVQNKEHEKQKLEEQAACSLVSQQTSMSSISKHYSPDSEKVYKMKSSPRGFAVIINMKSFASHNEGNIVLEERVGCESDLESLLTLMGFLNFKCKLFLDKGKDELLAACDEISKSDDLANYDCFAMFIMTHGEKGNVFYASDGETIEESFLVDMFGRCKALSEKPKLFFFQSCRGDQIDPGRCYHDGNSGEEKSANPQYTIEKGPIGPITSDILVSYSCYQGYMAYRMDIYGSIFIQSLVEIFTSNAENEDLKTMLTMVNDNVSKVGCQIRAIQMPVFTSTLRKPLYFWPGLIFET